MQQQEFSLYQKFNLLESESSYQTELLLEEKISVLNKRLKLLQIELINEKDKNQNLLQILNEHKNSELAVQLQTTEQQILALYKTEATLESQRGKNEALEQENLLIKQKLLNCKEKKQNLKLQISYLEKEIEEIKKLAWAAVSEKVHENNQLQLQIDQLKGNSLQKSNQSSKIKYINLDVQIENIYKKRKSSLVRNIEESIQMYEQLKSQNSERLIEIQEQMDQNYLDQLKKAKGQFKQQIVVLEQKNLVLQYENHDLKNQLVCLQKSKDINMEIEVEIGTNQLKQELDSIKRKLKEAQQRNALLEKQLDEQITIKCDILNESKVKQEILERQIQTLSNRSQLQSEDISEYKAIIQIQKDKIIQEQKIFKRDMEQEMKQLRNTIQKLQQENLDLEFKLSEIQEQRISFFQASNNAQRSSFSESEEKTKLFNEEEESLEYELSRTINRFDNPFDSSQKKVVSLKPVRGSFVKLCNYLNEKPARKTVNNPFTTFSEADKIQEMKQVIQNLELKNYELEQTVNSLNQTYQIQIKDYEEKLEQKVKQLSELRVVLAKLQDEKLKKQKEDAQRRFDKKIVADASQK